MNEFLMLFLICFSLVATAFFAGLETGIVAVNRLRLRHLVRSGVRGAATLDDFLRRPDHLFGTTLVGTNLFSVLASVAAVSLGTQWLGAAGTWSAEVIITVLILIFGEYLPKAWFQGQPAARALPFMPLLNWSGHLFYPVSRAVTLIARLLVPAPAASRHPGHVRLTLDELKHLTHEGEQSGSLTRQERRMIERVLDMTATPARHIMTPLDRVIRIHKNAPPDEALAVARAHGLSRLPVYQEDSGRYIGILYIFDLLTEEVPPGRTIGDLMRPPQFVDSETPADELLPRMRMNRQPMMLVRNTESRVIGLVTMEDVLEMIVGEF